MHHEVLFVLNRNWRSNWGLNCRVQKELTRITGQPAVIGAQNACSKAPVKVKAQKPRPQKQPAPPVGVASRLNAACLAVTASVDGLKTVSQDTFACSAPMRMSARSLGNIITAFVKLHTQLEPSLKISRSAPTIRANQGPLSTHQPVPHTSGLGNAAQHAQQQSPASSVPNLQSLVSGGFFGSASQSKGSGVSNTEVQPSSTNRSEEQVSHSVCHSQAGQTDMAEDTAAGEQDAATMLHSTTADEQPMAAMSCDEQLEQDGGGRQSMQAVQSEATEAEPLKKGSQSGAGASAPADAVQPPGFGECPSRHCTTSISSSVFSDRVDAESSAQVPKNSEATYSQTPSLSQSANPPAGAPQMLVATV